MTDLTTFDGLRAAVANYLGRDDLTDEIAGFIALAEAKFRRVLRTVNMEIGPVQLTPTADGSVALPSDFVEMRSIYTVGSEGQPLEFLAPDSAAVSNGYVLAGAPTGYTTIGSTLQVVPAGASPIKIIYAARLVPLSPAQPSNWLLANHPDVYFYGALAESARFSGDKAAGWRDDCADAIGDVMAADKRRRWGNGRIRPPGIMP